MLFKFSTVINILKNYCVKSTDRIVDENQRIVTDYKSIKYLITYNALLKLY